MMDIRQLFDTSDFPPRWTCGDWTPLHGWVHILSDMAIFWAYAAIPVTLAYFVYKRKDVPFPPVFWLFAVFIFSCGFGHLVDASLYWNPWYRLWGAIKVVTAIASWATVFALWRVMPKAMQLPGLAALNQKLEREAAEWLRAEERFRNVVESAPNAMVMVDRNGAITLVNRQIELLFGYSRAELLGQSIETLVPVRFRSGHAAHLRQFFSAPTSQSIGAGRDLFGLKRDGTEFPIEIGLNPVETSDGVAVLASVIDITDRKHAADQMMASLAEKETLLQEIHHRVKNNLQVISSLLQMQTANAQDHALLDAFRDAQQRIRAMALVHEKLYQSQHWAHVDFEDYLRSLLTQLVRSVKRGSGAVRTELELVPLPLSVDTAIPLGLIVSEIVTNSLKYAYQDREDGRLSVNLAPTADGRYRLEVADDGPGLPPDLDIDALDSMGLKLVRELSRQLGGELQVSREGGTCFTLIFRLSPSDLAVHRQPGVERRAEKRDAS